MGKLIQTGCLATLLVALPALAGAPPFVPVQGYLTDSSGVALNQSVDIRFALYDEAVAGNEIWSETQSVGVEEGLFVAYLGQAISLELSFFNAFENLYLGITVGNDTEMPRIHLGSVPFSGFSAYSSYVGGGGIYISGDNVISADLGNSVESVEISDGTISAADIGADAVTSSHVADGAIGSTDIAPNAVTSAHVADGAIGSADIGQDAVTSAHISDRSVVSADIGVGAVTTTEILDGTILPEDLAPGTGARVDWNPVDINLGSLPFVASTGTWDLPAEIPADAREVLVYVWYEKGAAGGDGRFQCRVYTQQGAVQYAKKFLLRSYNQDAWTFNSDNLWLPVTSERRIYFQQPGTITGNRRGEIHLLGYR